MLLRLGSQPRDLCPKRVNRVSLERSPSYSSSLEVLAEGLCLERGLSEDG